jgi:hypothetical protein
MAEAQGARHFNISREDWLSMTEEQRWAANSGTEGTSRQPVP